MELKTYVIGTLKAVSKLVPVLILEDFQSFSADLDISSFFKSSPRYVSSPLSKLQGILSNCDWKDIAYCPEKRSKFDCDCHKAV